MEPFLRWAGGKSWLKNKIGELIPKKFQRYIEPFLGGGSIFFAIGEHDQSFLYDINPNLINAYIQVRDNVEDVIKHLKTFRNTEKDYYRIRQTEFSDPSMNASKFIYLNKTSFNGIYRVNKQGNYNVPYGYRYTIDFISENNLRLTSQKLQKSVIECLDFNESILKAQEDDFVFLDPPYTTAHSNNNFIGYNQKLFSLQDQYKLATSLNYLDKIGAKYLLTNAYHEKIKEIYSGTGNFQVLSRMSLIGGKGAKRQNINEYIIKNY